MGYFGDYQRKAIAPGYVDKEGDYELKIVNIKTGEIDSQEGKKRYTQVECEVNWGERPHTSIFLTEGKTFDGNFTAFCDTFGIDPAGRDFNAWIGKRGYCHILLKQKDGFTNMVARWILRDGYVMDEVKAAANGGLEKHQGQSQQQPMQQQSFGAVEDQDFGDIPF